MKTGWRRAESGERRAKGGERRAESKGQKFPALRSPLSALIFFVMSNSRERLRFCLLFVMLLSSLAGGWRLEAGDWSSLEVTGIRVGFGGKVKSGYWTPIEVQIQSKNDSFTGILRIITPDSDGRETIIDALAFVGRNDRKTIHHYVKVDSLNDLEVKLIDPKTGRVVGSGKLDSSNEWGQSHELLESSEKLILTFGSPSGVESAARSDPNHEVIAVLAAPDLPVQWFAYESIKTLILATGSARTLAEIDRSRATAIQTWVRQGGHLVVSVADDWQVVESSFLGPMLPATLVGRGQVKQPTELEVFAGTGRLEVGDQGLPIAELSGVRGRALIQQGDRPLVVVGTYGLGKVTLLTFDTDRASFPRWEGRDAFWIELLGFEPGGEEEEDFSSYKENSDLASLLHTRLQDFPDVTVVPFGWVAALIFAYILLIGPVDYFFLKRVVGRLELTWITFPSWVILISACAYYAAYWLKGDELRINRIELIDVDADSATLRGTSFLAIFSPRIDRYTVAMEPGLAYAGSWADLDAASSLQPPASSLQPPASKMGREQYERTCSWLGLPSNRYEWRTARGGLLGGGSYSLNPSSGTVIEAPIQVWSIKTFTSRWIAEAAPVFEADLVCDGADFSGTLKNVSGHILRDVHILYEDREYAIPRMGIEGPDATAQVAPGGKKALISFLNRGDPGSGTPTLVRALMFNSYPENTLGKSNDYLHDLDLSDRLALGKMIVLARVEDAEGAEGGRLWLNPRKDQVPEPSTEPPQIPGIVRTHTFLRVILEPKRRPS